MRDSWVPAANRRILIIDDNAAIHDDFRKVLGVQAESSGQAALDILEADIFGDAAHVTMRPDFETDSAHQGQEGVAMAAQAVADGRPYAMAFVDMRMPPGWDGLETIVRLWAVDSDVQVVICSAHTDYDWTEVVQRLGHSDKLLVLRDGALPQMGKRSARQGRGRAARGRRHEPHPGSRGRQSAAEPPRDA